MKKIDKIIFLKEEVNKLRQKRIWDFLDFRKKDYLIFALEQYKKIYAKPIEIKKVNNLLNSVRNFEDKSRDFWLQQNLHYLLKNKKKVKEDLQNSDVDDKALLRLIEWDKSFLFSEPAQERILRAEAFGEDCFFYKLADVLKRDTGRYSKKIKKSVAWLKEILIEAKLNKEIDFDNSSQVRNLYNELSGFLTKERDNNETNRGRIKRIDAVLKLLEDENYFRYKWLRRHGLSSVTKK